MLVLWMVKKSVCIPWGLLRHGALQAHWEHCEDERSKRCLAARILEIPRNGIASRQLRMTWRAQFSKHPCNMLQLPRVDRFCGDSLFLDVGYKWLQYKHVFFGAVTIWQDGHLFVNST